MRGLAEERMIKLGMDECVSPQQKPPPVFAPSSNSGSITGEISRTDHETKPEPEDCR